MDYYISYNSDSESYKVLAFNLSNEEIPAGKSLLARLPFTNVVDPVTNLYFSFDDTVVSGNGFEYILSAIECQNTENDSVAWFNSTCSMISSYYYDYGSDLEVFCEENGFYDGDDFVASEMCCICGGGEDSGLGFSQITHPVDCNGDYYGFAVFDDCGQCGGPDYVCDDSQACNYQIDCESCIYPEDGFNCYGEALVDVTFQLSLPYGYADAYASENGEQQPELYIFDDNYILNNQVPLILQNQDDSENNISCTDCDYEYNEFALHDGYDEPYRCDNDCQCDGSRICSNWGYCENNTEDDCEDEEGDSDYLGEELCDNYCLWANDGFCDEPYTCPNGSDCADCGAYLVEESDESSNYQLWSATVLLPENNTFNYKFSAGLSGTDYNGGNEYLFDLHCGSNGYRVLSVEDSADSSSIVLDSVCFGKCYDCHLEENSCAFNLEVLPGYPYGFEDDDGEWWSSCGPDGNGYYNFAWDGGCVVTQVYNSNYGWLDDIIDYGFDEGFYYYGFTPGVNVGFSMKFDDGSQTNLFSVENDCCYSWEDQITCWDGASECSEIYCNACTFECWDTSIVCLEQECPDCTYNGDANFDGTLDVSDLVAIVDLIIEGNGQSPDALCAADVDMNSNVNVGDIIAVIYAILGDDGVARYDNLAKEAVINIGTDLYLESDGLIQGAQFTLVHESLIDIKLVDTYISDYKTHDYSDYFKTIVILATDGSVGLSDIATISGEYKISESIVINMNNEQIVTRESLQIERFELAAAYPNPFNPVTYMDLLVPQNGFISVKVYNLTGQEVATLIESEMLGSSSPYQLRWDASSVASGMYLVKAYGYGKILTQKLMLIK